MKKRYWLTPPEEFKKLNQEFAFDFDPCPCPRTDGPKREYKLPLPWSIALLMEAGAEVRYGGKWRWLEVDSKESGRPRDQGIFILRGKK